MRVLYNTMRAYNVTWAKNCRGLCDSLSTKKKTGKYVNKILEATISDVTQKAEI